MKYKNTQDASRSAERFKVIVSVNILLFKAGKYLLLRRANTGWADGHFNLPAGHVEKGESITQAAARETLEETGVHVEPGSLELAHVMYRSDRDDDHERMDVFLITTEWNGDPIIGEPDKADELAWFAPDELPENTLEHVKLAMKAIADKKLPLLSEVNW